MTDSHRTTEQVTAAIDRRFRMRNQPDTVELLREEWQTLRAALEPRAKRYAITGRLIPLSENGVPEIGLEYVREATHEVYLCPAPTKEVK